MESFFKTPEASSAAMIQHGEMIETRQIGDAHSFYMVGICRSGILTANNLAAVVDVGRNLGAEQPKEIVFAPIPEIPLAKYAGNLIHASGIEPAAKEYVTNEVLAMTDGSPDWRSMQGRVALETPATAVNVAVQDWQNHIYNIVSTIANPEMAAYVAETTAVLAGSDTAVLADMFALMDQALLNYHIRNNGIGHVSARADLPSRVRQEMGLAGKEFQPGDHLLASVGRDGGLAPMIVRFSDNMLNIARARTDQNPAQGKPVEERIGRQIDSIRTRFTQIREKGLISNSLDGMLRSVNAQLPDAERIVMAAYQHTLELWQQQTGGSEADLAGMTEKSARSIAMHFVAQIFSNSITVEQQLDMINGNHQRIVSAVDHYAYMLHTSYHNGVSVLRQNFNGTARDTDPFETALHRTATAKKAAGGGQFKIIDVVPPNEQNWHQLKDHSPFVVL